jgi:hypothetical protein
MTTAKNSEIRPILAPVAREIGEKLFIGNGWIHVLD